jgi:serine/threonine protein kinase/lipopolysaccharide biosynthesis regulator YciM
VGVSPEFTKTLETPTDDLTRGTLFADRYEIIEKIGLGGMGRVYRVEDNQIHEEIALKLIRPEISLEPKTIVRFKNELKIARKVTHRNVCRMFDIGEEDGKHFITMEYVSGENLKSMIRMSGHLGIGTALNIAKQICEGLNEAHRFGIIHRDLKPSNIMIDRSGLAKIMDFGIARAETSDGITRDGVAVGTPHYMSPEQIDGKPVDQRSDIYSLGIILYEMLTGKLPFGGDSTLSIAVKHLNDPPRSPLVLNPQIPKDLNALILKCLAKAKEERYESAQELLSDLNSIEKGVPTDQKKIFNTKKGASKEITVTLTKKRIFIPLVVFAAIAAAALLILRPWSVDQVSALQPDKPSIAVLYFENNSGDASLDHWRDALPDYIYADLQQSKYLRVLDGARIYGILKKLDLSEVEKYTTSDLERVAAEANVSHIIHGSYLTLDDSFIVNVSLFSALSQDEVNFIKEEGVGDRSIPDSVDNITHKLKASLQLTPTQIADDHDAEAGRIRSYSPEAMKYYSAGVKHYMDGRQKEAVPLLEEAITLDPEFVMAYRHLVGLYDNLHLDPEKRQQLLEKMLSLLDRASHRERYHILAGKYWQERDFRNSAKVFHELVDEYPDDFLGHRSLGVIYKLFGDAENAIKYAENSFRLAPESAFDLGNLIVHYRQSGRFEIAEKILKDFIQKYPGSESSRYHLALVFEESRQFEAALKEWDEMFQRNPDSQNYPRRRAEVYIYMDDFEKAENELQKSIESDKERFRFQGYLYSSFLHLYQGRIEKAIGLLENLVKDGEITGHTSLEFEARDFLAHLYIINDEPRLALQHCEINRGLVINNRIRHVESAPIFRMGEAYLASGSLKKTNDAAEQLKESLKNEQRNGNLRIYPLYLGKIELKQGNIDKAVGLLEESVNFTLMNKIWPLPQVEFLDPLAEAYLKAGDLDKAEEQYKKIQWQSMGRLRSGDIYVKSFFMLGKIYEQKGDTAKAIEHYQKFLDLWKVADPGIAEVEDAKARIAGLRQ